jgi:hypothetical protein
LDVDAYVFPLTFTMNGMAFSLGAACMDVEI